MEYAQHARVLTAEHVRLADLGDSFAILNLASGEYYDVVGSARAVVEILSAGPASVGEIRDRLLARYDVPADRCAAELQAYLEDLVRAGIIRVESA